MESGGKELTFGFQFLGRVRLATLYCLSARPTVLVQCQYSVSAV
jgi:hypothetical protein